MNENSYIIFSKTLSFELWYTRPNEGFMTATDMLGKKQHKRFFIQPNALPGTYSLKQCLSLELYCYYYHPLENLSHDDRLLVL